MARWLLAFACVVALAAALRLPQLAARPLHADEAIHADKLGTLLEGGGYAYDPAEYHGPTLYYLTLGAAWLAGVGRAVDVDEVLLRGVPAVLGILLVALHAGARGFLGRAGALVAALLTALSPAMVYYSRYAIHETLLVLFSFGVLLSAWHYARKPDATSAVTLGLCAGLMLATKETAGLALFAIVVAGALTRLAGRAGVRNAVRPRHAALALATAGVVCLVFFTSFFTRPQGIMDALRANSFYLERAISSWHVHPWDYYLRLLVHFPAEGTPFWSEGLILALAVVGGAAAWVRQPGTPAGGTRLAMVLPAGISARTMLRFLSLYSLILLGLYSAIPYKTPWCVLGFLHGMIVLSGSAVGLLVDSLQAGTSAAEPRATGSNSHVALRRAACATILAVLVAATAQLGWQAYSASFVFAADPRNPYVYAHTGNGRVRDRGARAGARPRPPGGAMPVQVISRDNVWPLPFYLRRLVRSRLVDRRRGRGEDGAGGADHARHGAGAGAQAVRPAAAGGARAVRQHLRTARSGCAPASRSAATRRARCGRSTCSARRRLRP